MNDSPTRVVRRRRLTPRNRSESTCYHADRRPICALNNTGDFTGLTALTFLHLADNQLADLPDGLFVGLTALTGLYLSGNPGAPFALPLGIEQVLESGGVYTLRVDFARRGTRAYHRRARKAIATRRASPRTARRIVDWQRDRRPNCLTGSIRT